MTAVPHPSPGTSSSAHRADRRQLLARQLRERVLAPTPLAPHQARLVALQQLDPQSSAYHEAVVAHLDGPLDVGALLRALRMLAERHPWLRSRLDDGGEEVLQVVDPGLALDVRHVHLDDGNAATAGERWAAALFAEPFDLTRRPPWRAGVARLAADRALLVLVVHHLACDATALAVLLDDLGGLYDAEVSGRGVAAPTALAPQQVVRRLAAAGPDPQARAALVRERADALAGTVPDARVPTAEPARADPTGPWAGGPTGVVTADLGELLSARVVRAAAELAVSPFAFLTACVAVVQARFTGSDSAVLGMPVDLRWRVPGSERTVAFLVETVALPLRDLSGATLRSASQRVRDAVLEALDRPVPFGDLVAELRTRGQLPPVGTPLHTYVNWLDGREETRLGELGPAVTHLDLPLGSAKFDLSWTGLETSSGLVLRLEYDAGCVDAATARRLVAHVHHLLAAATVAPGVPFGELPALPADELREVLGWEGRPLPVPDGDLLTLVLDGLTRGDQHRPAVVATVAETLQSGMVRERVEGLAAALLTSGVRPGDRVAVSSRRTAGMVVALLAVLKAGATAVPLDPAAPPLRQEALARAAAVRAVVGAGVWARALAGGIGAQPLEVDDGGRPLTPADRPSHWPARSSEHVAYLMFTSGSTGTPKAVVVTDGAVVARVASYRACLADRDVRLLAASPLTFDGSVFLFWALAVGGSLVIPSDAEAADPVALRRLLASQAVTDVFFVPALYEPVLQAGVAADLLALRRVLVGGEVFPPALVPLHAAVAPDAALLNVYGPTETVVTATSHTVRAPGAGAVVDAVGPPVPIGKPHPGTVVRVLDRHGRRVPVGVPGELHIGGAAVARGYDGQRADEAPFSESPGPDGSPLRWYATGDVVRWREDGVLVYLGRRDRQVKVRGQRVELGEVEAALRTCDGVREGAVDTVGEGAARQIVAFVAPAGIGEGVRRQLATLLPEAWVPDRVLGLDRLPRLASGKLDRAAMLDVVHAGGAAETKASHRRRRGRYHSRNEQAVLLAVQDLLGREDVMLDDEFFALGGNSLLAARLVGRLRAQTGAEIPLPALAGAGSLRELAALLDVELLEAQSATSEAVQLVPLRPEGRLAPLVLVARDGESSLFLRHLLRTMAPGRPLWVLLRPMPPVGPLVPDLARHGRLTARALRERFPEGPVHLLGHSASGVVAVEAARALGDRRGAVVLLDTLAPSPLSATALRWPAAGARAVVERLRLMRHGNRLGRLREDGRREPRVVEGVRIFQERQAYLRAQPWAEFPITLITAEETVFLMGRDDLGWRTFAPRLTVVPVGGGHLSMLTPPRVTETLRALDAALPAQS